MLVPFLTYVTYKVTLKSSVIFWCYNSSKTFTNMNKRNIQVHQLVTAPAAERNKQPILDVLKKHIPDDAKFTALEIAAGTGQHVVHFAKHFSNVEWQPCEYDRHSLQIIQDHISHSGLKNILPPLTVDASLPVTQWAEGHFIPQSYDIIYSANMMHISPWRVSLGFIEGCGQLLKSGGLMIIYGPFALDGVLEPESNVRFNMSLQSQNPEWGVREQREVEKVAHSHGFKFITLVDMPSNNKTLVFKKA